jgi:hypothetical protein
MTLKNRLSKLEASILPEVRPPKVVVIEGYRDGEDMDAARDRHFAPLQPRGLAECNPRHATPSGFSPPQRLRCAGQSAVNVEREFLWSGVAYSKK